ncbi:hypothetical protein Hbal_1820 [Hirschia baltica ATCC 49814]|uniref:Uncharacterized protein n=1 Tax=Hirschia baltica (strain ATCC 49814 / DSM 5838 / IFAM 1418) TaxID=582402 RepID=C6XK61_HIRBI|nr:hypothetical protein Hbal_1820 [Hirschia baltica ATCC 49814]
MSFLLKRDLRATAHRSQIKLIWQDKILKNTHSVSSPIMRIPKTGDKLIAKPPIE